MTPPDSKKGRQQTAAEFVAHFRGLTRDFQDAKAYTIAERHAPEFSTPDNIRASAIGIRLALIGERLPSLCSKRWRKGFVLGCAIRDGQLSA